jgi:hypothetical protein
VTDVYTGERKAQQDIVQVWILGEVTFRKREIQTRSLGTRLDQYMIRLIVSTPYYVVNSAPVYSINR